MWAQPAQAHSLGLSQLRVTETAPGRFTVAWLPSEELLRRGIDVRLRFPQACRYTPPVLSCGLPVDGEIVVEKLPERAEVIVQWRGLRGDLRHQVVPRARRIAFAHFGAPAQAHVWAYVGIGIEHIVLGIDHLAFVVSLLLLTGLTRRLIGAVTAFTVSHSLTLALSSMDLLALPPAPVELLIAASIVLVAREALVGRDTLARRFPWLIAFAFGLVHGLGFAGALREIGLPDGQALPALLAFNLGVELGQLGVLAIVGACVRLARSLGGRNANGCGFAISAIFGAAFRPIVRAIGLKPARKAGSKWLCLAGPIPTAQAPSGFAGMIPTRPVAAYAIGTLAMFWTLQRGVSIWSQ